MESAATFDSKEPVNLKIDVKPSKSPEPATVRRQKKEERKDRMFRRSLKTANGLNLIHCFNDWKSPLNDDQRFIEMPR